MVVMTPRLRHNVLESRRWDRIRGQKGSKMTKNDLEKAFLEAAEIAKKLPKNLQEAGFNRALEQLLGKRSSSDGEGWRTEAPNRLGAQGQNTNKGERNAAKLIDAIDRTSYPDIGATKRVADRALKVLQLAHQDYGVDGLTAAEIATILSRKFRLPVKTNSVNKALERETDTVDIRSDPGSSRVFHIMAPGDVYLHNLRSGKEGTLTQTFSAKEAKKASARKSPTTRESTETKKPTNGVTRKKTSSRPGPKAAVIQLIELGFFRAARTVSDIQQEMKHKRGHHYSLQELAPALVRSIRDGSLTRERNDTGHYEYHQA
jgi:hypothetical protein